MSEKDQNIIFGGLLGIIPSMIITLISVFYAGLKLPEPLSTIKIFDAILPILILASILSSVLAVKYFTVENRYEPDRISAIFGSLLGICFSAVLLALT
jgi:hypothetical protein